MNGKNKRIVVKAGTSTLTHESGAPNLRRMEQLARILADLHGLGHEVILVFSGAIAAGTARLGLESRPGELRMKQAAAAVGQCRMMHIFDQFFAEYNQTAAQILLSGDDVADPGRAEHLKGTFFALMEMGVIPVVNENDSVSSAEIETGRQKILGDNDSLSAIVARLCRAEESGRKASSQSGAPDTGDYGNGGRRRVLERNGRYGHQAVRSPDCHGCRVRHGDRQRGRDGEALCYRGGKGSRNQVFRFSAGLRIPVEGVSFVFRHR